MKAPLVAVGRDVCERVGSRRRPRKRRRITRGHTGAEAVGAAYIVPMDAAPSHNELQAFLRQRLPSYMVPSIWVLLEALPLTPNGKIDRHALPMPVATRSNPESSSVALGDALEKRLAGIWEKTLSVPVVDMDDNFFELGGHSLLAVNLFARIEKAFGRRLPLSTLFHAPTVGQLADVLRRESDKALGASLVAIQSHGSRSPFFCVHAADGEVLGFRALGKHLGADQPFYGYQARGQDEEQPTFLKIEDTAASYIRELRELQPEGPYCLGGVSYGDLVAFEMARQLRMQGQDVALLALLDTPHPDFRMSTLKRLHFHAPSLRRLGPLGYVRERAWEGTKRRVRNIACKLSLRIGYSLPHALRYTYVHNEHAQRVANYKPQSYAGRVTLFRAADFRVRPKDPSLGWKRVAAGGVEIHEVPGEHGSTLLKEPHVQVVAARLKACLDRAQTSSS